MTLISWGHVGHGRQRRGAEAGIVEAGLDAIAVMGRGGESCHAG